MDRRAQGNLERLGPGGGGRSGGRGGELNGRQIPLETSPQSRTNCGDAGRRRGTRDFSMIGHLCGDSVREHAEPSTGYIRVWTKNDKETRMALS